MKKTVPGGSLSDIFVYILYPTGIAAFIHFHIFFAWVSVSVSERKKKSCISFAFVNIL